MNTANPSSDHSSASGSCNIEEPFVYILNIEQTANSSNDHSTISAIVPYYERPSSHSSDFGIIGYTFSDETMNILRQIMQSDDVFLPGVDRQPIRQSSDIVSSYHRHTDTRMPMSVQTVDMTLLDEGCQLSVEQCAIIDTIIRKLWAHSFRSLRAMPSQLVSRDFFLTMSCDDPSFATNHCYHGSLPHIHAPIVPPPHYALMTRQGTILNTESLHLVDCVLSRGTAGVIAKVMHEGVGSCKVELIACIPRQFLTMKNSRAVKPIIQKALNTTHSMARQHDTFSGIDGNNVSMAFEKCRGKSHPTGREIAMHEILHLLLGESEVASNLRFHED